MPQSPSPAAPSSASTSTAVGAGVVSCVLWGGVPLLFQAADRAGASASEISAQRAIWGLVCGLVLVTALRGWPAVVAILRRPRTTATLVLSALMIGSNWVLFAWAVNNGRTLDASLAYFIIPLVSVALGAVAFRERVGLWRGGALALAAAGVLVEALATGKPPVVSLVLAVVFSGYGLIRKQVQAEALPGFVIESLVLAPLGLVWAIWAAHHGQASFLRSADATALLILGGPFTAVPLVLFAWATRRLTLTTMGFLQFIRPSLQFVIGIANGEPFGWVRAAGFVLIWIGIAVFADDGRLLSPRRWRKPEGDPKLAVHPPVSDPPSEPAPQKDPAP